MAPARTSPRAQAPAQEVDHSGRNAFEASLVQFGQERGIPIDLNIRVATKPIDLYRLYKIVTARGGYDAVSGEKLAWRGLALDFGLGTTNAAAYAFALKTAYYKNLGAYEIKHVHGKEPPPVEILENLTARGGNIVNRTTENFQPVTKTNLGNESDSENEESKTPKEDKMDLDEPTSGTRSTRGLRQQPPQRVLFQPEVGSSRQTRHSSGASPQPTFPTPTPNASSYNPTSSAFSIANYEPKPQIPLTLRTVMTPSNNYALFQAQVKKVRDAKLAALGLGPPTPTLKPGAGFSGPNIYVRILNSLRSPLEAEQDFALHHLVKISHERGDKYRFDAFAGLADGLLERLLSVGSLFYDVDWQISYSGDEEGDNILDGINGTADILQRIEQLQRIDSPDDLQPGQLAHKLNKILEAGLTLRNLALLDENAIYLSEMAPVKDLLCIILNLPSPDLTSELKNYALDVAEQVVRYWRVEEDDPLYLTLLKLIDDGSDRGAIVTALRTLCRISMNLEEANSFPAIPISMLSKLFDWIVLEDEEFTTACLDFLYQHTAWPKNVLYLFSNCNDLPLSPWTMQLARLLQYRATPLAIKNTLTKAVAMTAAEDVPKPPKELLDQFLRHEEPERSRLWLRSTFEEDPPSFITQIALWQAYQSRFLEHANATKSPLLQAAEFIKNVSNVFQGANAQVVNGPNQRFIIKGIRPRHAPMDTKGRTYSRCRWHEPGLEPCTDFHLKPRHMHEHIARTHLQLDRSSEGSWNLEANNVNLPKDCFWANCHHFERRGQEAPTARDLLIHVKTHLPDITVKSSYRKKNNRTPANQFVPVKLIGSDIRPASFPNIDPEHGREASHMQLTYHNTSSDHLGNAEGLPLTSVLILRNLARNVPKAMKLIEGVDPDVACTQAMQGLFDPIMERLMYVIGHNRPLAGYASEVVALVEKGMAH